ncbi:urease accessory protein UreF [Halococcoides cellulosivorans]|uniref:Urease accessory protein UreF n=1 Tax=Halococcoides cellulosivorans TaxID=1679096 RepID=A0A2R4X0F0_9EURY|nr:urease accessory UreF family protein [Halococcoides cellulosivorans]AWB27241.1 urease accessory protein UreF [Halococcoides cellulosivorans]
MTDLAAFQLADSFLPTGSYAHSYGLEQCVVDDRVGSVDELRGFLDRALTRQIGPSDMVALRAAHRAARDGDVAGVVQADRRLEAATLPAEFRESARRAGERLAEIWVETRDAPLIASYRDRDPPHQGPAVLGAVAAVADIDADRACRLHGYRYCSDLLGAGQRLLSLGHTDAQRILTDLGPAIETAVADSADRPLDRIGGTTPLIDIASARHERADRRLFRS